MDLDAAFSGYHMTSDTQKRPRTRVCFEKKGYRLWDANGINSISFHRLLCLVTREMDMDAAFSGYHMTSDTWERLNNYIV